MTLLKDSHGHAVSGANAASLALYEQATHQLRCLIDDPLATVDAALAASPDMTMAHVLRAWLYLLSTEPAARPVAQAICEDAASLPANDRERRHLHAAGCVATGRWRDGARALEDLSVVYPTDALALQAGHQTDFFTGDSRLLRDRIARALPHWHAGMPGHHALLGMHAFGLEETGDYAQAERVGRRAVETEPRDSWAWHAVAHVMEMRNQPAEGIAWLQPNAPRWSQGSFLAGHNWWHLALFHLEQEHFDEVLRVYDTSLGGLGSGLVLDLVDQSALLWRLSLRGVDVGGRWQPVADRWAAAGEAGQYAFNDLHAMAAYVGAGQHTRQQQVLEAQQHALLAGGDNVAFTAEVGGAATRALHAFGHGDMRTAADLLRSVRSRAHRFGGSHAQRDLLDLTLIESALRGDDPALAAALVAERTALRPASPMSAWLQARQAGVTSAAGAESPRPVAA